MADQKKFDVHLFYPVKFKVAGVSLPAGSTHADAMKAAADAMESMWRHRDGVFGSNLGHVIKADETPLPSGARLESIEYIDEASLRARVDVLLENGKVDNDNTRWLNTNGHPDSRLRNQDSGHQGFSELQQNIVENYCGGDMAHVTTMAQAEECGDTLLLFLLREAGDAGNQKEFLGMLDAAAKDLADLQSSLTQDQGMRAQHGATMTVLGQTPFKRPR